MERRIVVLFLAETLHVAGWAVYFTATRMVFSDKPGLLVALAAVETLPTGLGLVGGYLSSRLGFRASVMLGVPEAATLLAVAASLSSQTLLLLIVFSASMSWSIAGPQLYGYILSRYGPRGLGLVSAGSSLGYSVGSGLAPILVETVGAEKAFAAAGLAVAAAYATALPIVEGKPARARRRLVGWPALALVVGVAALAYVAGEILGSVYMARLSAETTPVVYGVANFLAGVASALTRPIAGVLAEHFSGQRLLAAIIPVYILYIIIVDASHGTLLAALWIIPLHPFLEIGLYSFAADMVGEAYGSAAVSSAYSVTGAILLALDVLAGENPSMLRNAAISSLAASMLLLSLARHMYGRGRGKTRLNGGEAGGLTSLHG